MNELIRELISQFLLPQLLKCFEKTSIEDPQTFLRSNYNATTGRMNRDVVEDAIPQTRRAIRKARQHASREERRQFPRFSRSDLYEVAERDLIEAMNAPPEVVSAIRAEAQGIFDEDDE